MEETYKITDYFCGGGGSGSGLLDAVEAVGKKPEGTFINHWDQAIKTHSLNHPEHRHFNCEIGALDLDELFPEKDIDFLWASPSCVFYSRARGAKPVKNQMRASAFCVVRFVRKFKPPAGAIENVPEFTQWGSLRQKRDPDTNQRIWLREVPHPTLKGQTLQEPTTQVPFKRKRGERWRNYRLRLEIARYTPSLEPDPRYKGGMFRKWAAHMRREGYDLEWRILKCCDYGDPTTRRRVFVRFVRRDSGLRIVWPEPTHVEPDADGHVPPGKHKWVTAREIIDWENPGQSIYSRKRPLAKNTLRRIAVGLARYGTKGLVDNIRFILSQQAGGSPARDVEVPLGPVATRGAEAVVSVGMEAADTASIIRFKGQSTAESVDCPLSAQTSNPSHYAQSIHIGEVDRSDLPECQVVLKMRGTGTAQDPEDPLHTVTAGGISYAIIQAFLHSVNLSDESDAILRKAWGVNWKSKLEGMDNLSPEWEGFSGYGITIDHSGSAGGGVIPPEKPLSTQTTKQRHAAVETSVESSNDSAYLLQYYSQGQSKPAGEPLATVTTKERHAVIHPFISVEGRLFVVDVKLRMMFVRELARAQGFPEGYKFTGNQTQQVRQIGNAVPKNTARAILLAHLTQNSNIDDYACSYEKIQDEEGSPVGGLQGPGEVGESPGNGDPHICHGGLPQQTYIA